MFLCFGLVGIATADSTVKVSDIVVHVNEQTGEISCDDSQLTVNSDEQLYLSTVNSNFDGELKLSFDNNEIYNGKGGYKDLNLTVQKENTIKCSIADVDAKSLIGKDAGTITYTLRTKIDPVAPATIYPAPKHIDYKPDSQFYLKNQVSVLVDPAIDQVTKDYFKNIENKNGIQEVIDSLYIISLNINKNLSNFDEYTIDVNKHGINITGRDTDAVYRGLQTLSSMLEQKKGDFLEGCSVHDYAQAQWRGFIEGYYGIPWTNENRISLMEFGNQFKMNSYIFAPKDDPYHSSQWRDPYPEEQLSKMEELAQAGLRTKVDFTWAIHPFLHNAFNFDNYDADLKTITDKFEQLYSIGVRHFGLSADDIGSAHPVSAEQQLKVLLDLDKWCQTKGDVKKLLFVPECYQKNRGGEEKFKAYWAVMKDAPQSIDMMWTGDQVMSWTTQETFDFFKQVSQHDAYMWWNYSVNDYCKNHLLMGPPEMLVPNTKNFIGLVSNPMQQAQASKTALFAVANYTWDTTDFDINKVWEASFKFIDSGAPDALKLICKHLCYSKNTQGMDAWGESEYMKADIDTATEALKAGNKVPQDVSDKLKANYKEIQNAINEFSNNHVNNGLFEEMEPWLKSLNEKCEASVSMLEAIANPNQQIYEFAKMVNEVSALHEVPKLASQADKVYAEPGHKRLVPFINEMFAYYEKLEGVKKAHFDLENDEGYGQLTLDSCTKEDYDQLCAQMARAKWNLHSESDFNNNVSATYTRGNDLNHIYYTPTNRQIRTITRKDSPAPPKEVIPVEDGIDESASIVKLYSDSLCCVYQLADGSFVVLDSGVKDSTDAHRSSTWLYDLLKELAPDENNIIIRMWYFSHPHGDHIGGFVELCDYFDKIPEYKNIHIESFLYNFAGTQKAYQHANANKSSARQFEQYRTKYFPDAKVYKALTGQVYQLPGAKLEVLYSMSDFTPAIIGEELENTDNPEWVKEEARKEAADGKGDGNQESACVKLLAISLIKVSYLLEMLVNIILLRW